MRKEDIDLRNFRLIVFDIDGTLAGSDHQIHSYTRETLFRLRDEGFPFTLATGKNLPATITQADELEVDLPLVLINGGMLRTRRGKVLRSITLPEDVVKEVVIISEQHDRDLVMYIDDGIYFREMNDNIGQIYGHIPMGLHAIEDWGAVTGLFGRVNKCLVVDTSNRENLFEMGDIFEKAFQGSVDILHTSVSLLEVMPKGVTKMNGLRALAQTMNISLTEVMTFGDFDNDVEMLTEAGLGAAVSNASPRAKEAADIVIESVDEQGPARFLERLLDRLS